MSFSYERRYRGSIQSVIFDWAGTTIDFGCLSPVVIFQKVFENSGVPITLEEARAPMGAHKKVHIQMITQLPSVNKRWQKKFGKAATEEDVERLFKEFVPLQLECLASFSRLIPGTLDVVSKLRDRGYKIGSTTGYTDEMMAIVQKEVKKQGFLPESIVCANQVPVGRPYPFMLLQNLINLKISPVEACVKIDDTIPGIEEGLNAGCWTIGLAVSGNEVGLSFDDWQALSKADQQRLRQKATHRHIQSGAHYVVDSIQDIMPCLDDIERRLQSGERP